MCRFSVNYVGGLHSMIKKLVIFMALSLMSLHGKAQEVKSAAYGTTLKMLLSHSVPEIDVKDAAADKEKYIFLDSRTKEEYDVSYIKGARWIGYDEFDLDKVSGIDKNKPVIVYCSVGYRSEKITEKLKAAGFTNVSNLYGGIFEWVNEGHPVVNDKGPTNKIHGYSKTWGIWLKKGDKVYK